MPLGVAFVFYLYLFSSLLWVWLPVECKWHPGKTWLQNNLFVSNGALNPIKLPAPKIPATIKCSHIPFQMDLECISSAFQNQFDSVLVFCTALAQSASSLAGEKKTKYYNNYYQLPTFIRNLEWQDTSLTYVADLQQMKNNMLVNDVPINHWFGLYLRNSNISSNIGLHSYKTTVCQHHSLFAS